MTIEEAVDKAYLFCGLPKLAKAWQTNELWLLFMVPMDTDLNEPIDIGSTVVGVNKTTGETNYCVITPN